MFDSVGDDVGLGVSVPVGVNEGNAVELGVSVDVGVGSNVCVGVGVRVELDGMVGVSVAVDVCVAVAVGVSTWGSMITSIGPNRGAGRPASLLTTSSKVICNPAANTSP